MSACPCHRTLGPDWRCCLVLGEASQPCHTASCTLCSSLEPQSPVTAGIHLQPATVDSHFTAASFTSHSNYLSVVLHTNDTTDYSCSSAAHFQAVKNTFNTLSCRCTAHSIPSFFWRSLNGLSTLARRFLTSSLVDDSLTRLQSSSHWRRALSIRGSFDLVSLSRCYITAEQQITNTFTMSQLNDCHITADM